MAPWLRLSLRHQRPPGGEPTHPNGSSSGYQLLLAHTGKKHEVFWKNKKKAFGNLDDDVFRDLGLESVGLEMREPLGCGCE